MRTLESLIKKHGGWNKIKQKYPSSDYSDNFNDMHDFLTKKEFEYFLTNAEAKKTLNSIKDTLDYIYSSYENIVENGVPVPECVIVQILTNALCEVSKRDNFPLGYNTCVAHKRQFLNAFKDFSSKSLKKRAMELYDYCIKDLLKRFVFHDFEEETFWYDFYNACNKNNVLPIYKYSYFKNAHPEFNDELEYFEKNIEMPYNKITMSKF